MYQETDLGDLLGLGKATAIDKPTPVKPPTAAELQAQAAQIEMQAQAEKSSGSKWIWIAVAGLVIAASTGVLAWIKKPKKD